MQVGDIIKVQTNLGWETVTVRPLHSRKSSLG